MDRFKLLSRNELEKYKLISKKQKIERSEEEEEFHFKKQNSYFSLLVAKYSFVLAVALTIIYTLYIMIIK